MTDLGIIIGLILATAISGNAIVKHEYEIAGQLSPLCVRPAGAASHAPPKCPIVAPAGARSHEIQSGSR